MRDDKAFVERAKARDLDKYADYLFGQVKELLTDFGRIDTLFLDYSFPAERQGPERVEVRKAHQADPRAPAGIIVNDRLDLLDVPGGWTTARPSSSCPGMGQRRRPARPLGDLPDVLRLLGLPSRRVELEVVRQLIVMLIETVSKGGNLLLNVGPTARGTFDARALERLSGIGRGWT